MENKNKRVFIGVPCYGDVSAKLLEDWMRWMYNCGRRLPQYDFFLGIKTKSEQFRARIALVEGAQQVNADYLLMIDDDMILDIDNMVGTSDSYNLVDKLIRHDKDVCGVLYYQRGGSCQPVLMKSSGSGYVFLKDNEIVHGLQEVDVAGGGCLLIKMGVFDKISSPFFAPEHKFGTDIQLCQKVKEKGMEVFVDTSIELGHLKVERTLVTSRNRHQHQVEDMIKGEDRDEFISSDVYNTLIEDAKKYTHYDSVEDMIDVGNAFHGKGDHSVKGKVEWYKKFPMERIARQVAYNLTPGKRSMTDFIMRSINHKEKLKVLDFGCGIGIPSYELAKRGHKVTALDLAGTETFKFLRWRTSFINKLITFIESPGGVPSIPGKFDVVIAMDSIEHIEDWKGTLKILVDSLSEGGVLFSNNGFLEDNLHIEHYSISGKEFLMEVVKLGLTPINAMTFLKREIKENAA